MKIKERTKKFVKDHKGEIISVLCEIAAIGGTAIVAVGSFKLGQAYTYGEFEYHTGIDMSRDFAYGAGDCLLKEVIKENKLTEDLIKCGFDAIDNQAKVALLVQKK